MSLHTTDHSSCVYDSKAELSSFLVEINWSHDYWLLAIGFCSVKMLISQCFKRSKRKEEDNSTSESLGDLYGLMRRKVIQCDNTLTVSHDHII